MLFLFDLPIEADEEAKPKKDKKKFSLHIVNKEKWIIGSIVLVTLMIIVGTAGVLMTYKTPENISPYCKMMKDEGKICKIHGKKHEEKGLKDLVIPEGEMAFHRQLAEEIEKGAYFDGDKLYKKEDAEEIWTIKDNFIKEKESLFERYLASTLSQQEKERYNFLIEELVTLEEAIMKLGIEESASLPLQEELPVEQTQFIEQIEETQPIEQIEQVDQQEQSEPIAQGEQKRGDENSSQTPQRQSSVIFEQSETQTLNIPPDIEKAATLKKSSLYNY